MPYTWTAFTAYLDGTREIKETERDELWTALAYLLTLCGGRWQLKTADMDAIKASHANTDLTSVEDTEETLDPVIGDLAKVLIDIEDTFTGTTGYDAFKAVRAAEGLASDEELALLITEDGRVTLAATFHVWNLYKRVLTALQCCPTGEPTPEDDSVPASKTKVGFYIRDDSYAPISNKRYLTRSQSGVVSYVSPAVPWVNTYGGSQSMDYDGVLSGTITLAGTSSATGCTLTQDTDNTLPASGYLIWLDGPWSSPGPGFVGFAVFRLLVDVFFGCVVNDLRYIATTRSASETSSVFTAISPDFSGSATASVADEYTTALLKTNAEAALPSFDDDFNDAAGSHYFLSDDDLNFDIQDSRRRWNISAVAGFTVGRTYRLKYLIRFVPETGAPTDGDETYLEFTFTEGMTRTPYVEVPRPTENGDNYAIWTGWECPAP